MSFHKCFSAALLLTACTFLSAADLTFDLQVGRSAEVDSNPKVLRRTVAYFMIDCSGSMSGVYIDQNGKEYHGPGNNEKPWSRVKLVCEKLLPERLENLPIGTQIYAYLYGCDKHNAVPYIVDSGRKIGSKKEAAAFCSQLKRAIYDKVKMNGCTPYYDTCEMVLKDIREKGLLDQTDLDLMIYNYTDGQNATNGFEGFRYNSCQPKEKEDSGRYESECREAARLFMGQWEDFLKRVSEKAFVEKLNIGTVKENPKVKHIPAYKVAFKPDLTTLKSIREKPQQRIYASLTFPMSSENWRLLCGSSEKVAARIQINGKKTETITVPLKTGVVPVTFHVPDELGDGKISVTVSFTCPKKIGNSFTLTPPSPVTFQLPSRVPTIESVIVSPEGRILKGEKPVKVYIKVIGNAKSYKWTLDGRKWPERGDTVECDVKKTGKITYAVEPEDNAKAAKHGQIDVVSIGIKLNAQKTATKLGDTASFTAELEPGSIRPQKCKWYLVCPVKKEEAVQKPAVVSKTKTDACASVNRTRTVIELSEGGLTATHKFDKSIMTAGEYKVQLVALYDNGAQVIEKEIPWKVIEPAEIGFVESSTKAEGAHFEYGQQASLQIKAAAGDIDTKSIRWFANGKELQKYRGAANITAPVIPADPNNPQKSITYLVTANDRNFPDGKPLKLSRTYTFGCSHQEPEMEAKRALDGRFSWGVNEKVLFTIKPADAYKEISLDFGDGSSPVSVTNGQSCEHAFEKAGVYQCTLRCQCCKCKKEFTLPKSFTTESHVPKPVLKLSTEKASYAKDEGLTIADAGTGDYTYCRLMLKDEKTGDFKQLGDVQRKNYADFQVAFGKDDFEMATYRADFTIKLQAMNKDANGEYVVAAETKERTLRIRNHWIDAGILAGVIAFFIVLISLMKKFLFGNEPCGWELYYTIKSTLISSNDSKGQNKLRDQILEGISGGSLSLKKYWTVWTLEDTKKAVIPAQELDSDVIKRAETMLRVYNNDDARWVSISDEFELKSERLPVEDPNRFKSAIFGPKEGATSKAHSYIYLILDMSESNTRYKKLFYALCFLSLSIATAAALWLFMF